MPSPPLSIAMISVHSSPLGKLGRQDTGGMSVYIRELSRQLGRRGHRVDVFTRASADPATEPVVELANHVRLIAVESGAPVDAPKAALYAYLADFFRQMDRFRINAGLDYDLVHSHYWLSGQVGAWAARSWKVPHITTFHTLGAVKNRLDGAAPEPPERLAVESGLAAGGDRLLVTSARERANLARYYGADPERIAVVPCGVNFELFRPLDRRTARARIGAAADGRLALYVGRFAPEKGLDRLIAATARLRHITDLRLIVVGGDEGRDPARRRLAEMSRTLGVADRVEFRGRKEQSELPAYYAAADALVLPSAYESFGMVALEALACGTPVAATPVGAMEDLLADPRNGRLAKGFDPPALAAAVEDLLRGPMDSPLRAEAIRRSVARYGWPQVAQAVLGVYHSTLSVAHGGEPSARTACCGCGRFGHH